MLVALPPKQVNKSTDCHSLNTHTHNWTTFTKINTDQTNKQISKQANWNIETRSDLNKFRTFGVSLSVLLSLSLWRPVTYFAVKAACSVSPWIITHRLLILWNFEFYSSFHLCSYLSQSRRKCSSVSSLPLVPWAHCSLTLCSQGLGFSRISASSQQDCTCSACTCSGSVSVHRLCFVPDSTVIQPGFGSDWLQIHSSHLLRDLADSETLVSSAGVRLLCVSD